jgi:hypothetical protein
VPLPANRGYKEWKCRVFKSTPSILGSDSGPTDLVLGLLGYFDCLDPSSCPAAEIMAMPGAPQNQRLPVVLWKEHERLSCPVD